MKYLFIPSFILFLSLSANAQVTVNVDTSDKKQTIRGMGCQHNTTPDLIGDLLYDMGASSYRVFAGENSEGFWNEPINDNADPDVLDLSGFPDITGDNLQDVLKAKARGCMFYMTIGSPPGWMKDTTKDMYWMRITDPSEIAIFKTHLDAGGKLKSTMNAEFGEFALGAIMKFKQQVGIDLCAVNFQNEPKFSEPYYSCVYTGTEAVNATRSIAEKLKVNGINSTKIIFPEHGLYEIFAEPDWSRALNNDTFLTKYTIAFATHGYSGKDPNAYIYNGGQSPTEWALAWKEANRVATYKKEIWMTEGGPSVDPTSIATDIEVAMGGGLEFFNAMTYGNSSVYSCRELRKSQPARYSSIKNYVRYIRPGSVRMVTKCSDTASILSLAFRAQTKGAYALYVVNRANTAKKVKVNWAGASGMYDVFRTSKSELCEWTGQVSITDSIVFPALSISTLLKVTGNKLPVFQVPDTIVLIKGTGSKLITVKGINDGGEGGQSLVMKAWQHQGFASLLNTINVTYNSPDTSGTITLSSSVSGKTFDSTRLMISVSDQSMALDSMFNEKIISVPVYLIPFINRAPVLNDILDQTYTSDQINQQQVLSIGPVSDGNDGSQKLSLRISSTLPGVATITTLGSSILNITPKTNGTTIVTVTLKDDGLSVGGGVNSITKTFKIVVGTGIYSMEDNSDPFVIYPNPTRGIFTIGNALNTELSIVNTDGTVIEKRKCISEAEQFNISEAANGMYLIQMIINNKCITKKVFLAK